ANGRQGGRAAALRPLGGPVRAGPQVAVQRDRRSRFNAGPQREALAVLDVRARDRFLDVGCGTGAAVRGAAAVAARAVGVDLSERMVERPASLLPREASSSSPTARTSRSPMASSPPFSAPRRSTTIPTRIERSL